MFGFIKKEHYGELEIELERIEPAWAKAALFFRSNCVWRLAHEENTIRTRSLLDIWQELEARHKRFKAGDTVELLHAIKICAEENLPLPTWLATAFNRQFTATLKPGGPVSLDDAFTSRSTPKTDNKRKQQVDDWQIGGKLFQAVWELVIKDESYCSLDPAIDRVLADNSHFVIGKTKARQLVEMIDKNQTALLPSYKGFSRFFRKRRKG